MINKLRWEGSGDHLNKGTCERKEYILCAFPPCTFCMIGDVLIAFLFA
jgi:hypothetical protein